MEFTKATVAVQALSMQLFPELMTSVTGVFKAAHRGRLHILSANSVLQPSVIPGSGPHSGSWSKRCCCWWDLLGCECNQGVAVTGVGACQKDVSRGVHVRALTCSLADYLDLGEGTVRKELWRIEQADLWQGEGLNARTHTGTPSPGRSVGRSLSI